MTEMFKSRCGAIKLFKPYPLRYGRPTFENDTDNPFLLFRSSAVVYSLHNFRLCVSRHLMKKRTAQFGKRAYKIAKALLTLWKYFGRCHRGRC